MTADHGEVAVDLTTCDREPIHVPGAIQPHGVLLALREPALVVAQASDNVADHLGRDLAGVLDRPLADAVGASAAAAIAEALADGRSERVNPLAVRTADGRAFDAIVHRHDGVAIVELEPAAPGDAAPPDHPLRLTLHDVERARSLPELYQRVIEEIQRLTGFERVLLYRFDEDGHGAVEAEVRPPSREAYLGLHYPASDIPLQARRLYLQSWLRIIPDARYAPARLVPARRPDTGAPLDLSRSVLRSVSPIHLEYLANMGIRASMSVSLVVRGALWGLVSCGHHSGPRRVPYAVRSVCETLGRLASLQIAAFADRDASERRAARRPVIAALAAAMRAADPSGDLLDALLARPAELLGLVDAGGAAVVRDGAPRTCGRTPPPDVVTRIAAWLEARGDGAPFETAALPATCDAARGAEDVASGLVTIALPGAPLRRLIWFRPELVDTVRWGGDPRKPVEATPDQRLHPRRSFEIWKEVVRHRSRRFTAADVEAAEELRREAVELDLARQVERERAAVRVRDDLVAVVSHDLRSPLEVVQIQAAVLLRTGLADHDERARRVRAAAARIERAVDRMNALIQDLLDLAKIEAGRFALHRRPDDPGEIVEELLAIMRPLADARRLDLAAELVDTPRIDVDRERVFQVLSNLVGNAIKFTPPGGRIRLRAERRGGALELAVADTGPGIPPDQLPHVFDRYWQARRAGIEGTGLGLFIARGIVEAHGGRIWAESTPGAGTTLRFTLPLANS